MNDFHALAAEYVLGTLPHTERLAAQSRFKSDPEFAAEVALWEQRLAPLNALYTRATPPNLLPRIEARLFAKAPSRWRFPGLLAAATSALAGVALLAYLALTPPQPSLTATLAAEGSATRYAAKLEADGLHLIHLAGPAPDAAHAHELWLIVADQDPISLGIVSNATFTLPAIPLKPGMILAITLEPAGGSSTGKPTGPVLALGPLITAS